jgi:thiol-disulfide isomerase/thioredoxin
MAYLSAAVIVLGVLCLANMALTLAAIRRLREHGELLSQQAQFRPAPRIPPGTPAPEFTAVLTDGDTCSLADLGGARSVIAFLAPRCAPCRTELPEFAEFARRMPGGAAQVLVVLTGGDSEVAEFTAALRGVASVTIEPRRGPVGRAFSVGGYPTFYLLDENGVIQAGGATVGMVAAPALA